MHRWESHSKAVTKLSIYTATTTTPSRSSPRWWTQVQLGHSHLVLLQPVQNKTTSVKLVVVYWLKMPWRTAHKPKEARTIQDRPWSTGPWPSKSILLQPKGLLMPAQEELAVLIMVVLPTRRRNRFTMPWRLRRMIWVDSNSAWTKAKRRTSRVSRLSVWRNPRQ